MSNKTLRWMLIAGLALAASFGQAANADIRNASATNVHEGDNENDTEQDGSAKSGDAVAGQVVGVVGGGDVSVDATNRSEDVDVETGDAEAYNTSDSFVGLTPAAAIGGGGGGGGGGGTVSASDILNLDAVNVQEGDNEYDLEQNAEAASGDGVGGQVIGVVSTDNCTCGGNVSIVAANTSEDVDIETGDAFAENDADAFVGLNGASATAGGGGGGAGGGGGGGGGGGTITAADHRDDIINLDAVNVQEGDNELDAEQDANASSGDGVGGQVLGVVSAGDASIDATNLSEDVDVETGEAEAFNEFDAFVGLNGSGDDAGGDTGGGTVTASDILNEDAENVLEGDNERDLTQNANAASGDAVAGQVAGVVTSAGGSADLVLASTSLDSDAESGESEFENFDDSFTGLNASGVISVF